MMRLNNSLAVFNRFKICAANIRSVVCQSSNNNNVPAALILNRHLSGGAGIGNVGNPMFPTSLRKPQELFKHCKSPRTVSIIGAPMTYGQPFVGTDSGPTLLRKAGLRSMLTSLGWRVEDLPNLCFEKIAKKQHLPASDSHANAKNAHIIGPSTEKLANLVQSKIEDGNFPLIVGGDHSIGIGSLAGILNARPNTGVLWIDAHADLNTPETSGSGNMHGMPVGMLMKGVSSDSDSNIPGFEWLASANKLAPDSIVYVGLRDVDVPEREFIRKLNICAFTMHDIDRYGIGKVMEMSLQHLLKSDPNRPLHLSYDIDAVDPVLAPATGTTVRGGLTFREAHYVAEAIAQSGNLASAEIVELNPSLSDGTGAKETVELGLQILTSFMGKSII